MLRAILALGMIGICWKISYLFGLVVNYIGGDVIEETNIFEYEERQTRIAYSPRVVTDD